MLRITRPDRSVRTWWRETPDDNALKDLSLEAVLPEAATLTALAPTLLKPDSLSGLWETTEVTLAALCTYFSGGKVVKILREGYEEPVTIPKAERTMIEDAVYAAVREGSLWLTAGPASFCGEKIPAGVLTDDARLQGPPASVPAMDVLPENLPEAWSENTTTALAIAVALSQKMGKTLPWVTVQKAIDGACRARFLERTLDSGSWPCDFAGAQSVKLRTPHDESPPRVAEQPMAKSALVMAAADLRPNQIQDLAEQMAELVKAAAGHGLKFHLRIELGGSSRPPDAVVTTVNRLLQEVSGELRLREA